MRKMRKTLTYSFYLALVFLLISCDNTNVPTELYKLPNMASGVSLVLNETGGIKQLTYSVSVKPEDLSMVAAMEHELISNGFTRCDLTNNWLGVANNEAEKKRHVRFYRGKNKYRLATLSVDQTCKQDSGECVQTTSLILNSFPWWMIDREGLIKQMCRP